MAGNLLRRRDGEHYTKVAFVELFFDLVFVFAITQLSHGLLAHYSLRGAFETGFLMLAVWWVWIFSTWALNWLDPRTMAVRLLLYALMLSGLFISMSIPLAFGERGLAFALAYVASQVGRSLFTAWAAGPHERATGENFLRIAIWLAVSGVFWIAGGFLDGDARVVLWLIALAIEYAGPWLGFRVPGIGVSTTQVWNVSGEHISERAGLFVIIALGETLLVSGATFAQMNWTSLGITVFLVSFVSTVAMWWNYFHIGHRRAAHLIEHSENPGALARVAFTYAHIPIIAGIVLCAVGSELVIAHPLGHTDPGVAASIIGGPALFLGGVLWFKRLTWLHAPLSHMVGLALMAATVPFATHMSPFALMTLVTAIQVLVAVWEAVSIDALDHD